MSTKDDKSDHCIESVQDISTAERQAEVAARRKAESALLWKQDKRIIPLCGFIYLLCFLDRANIGNARTLNADTHDDLLSVVGMDSFQFTIALMTFLIAYTLFELPSNYFLKKTSPSSWLALLMAGFGALTMGIGGSKNYATVATLRFFLGAFEAGVFPGLVYYVTFWYRSDERSLRVAFFFASATLAGAFGGALAFGIGRMNMVQGLEGWRWLFILEGMLSLIASVGVYFLLPDYPDNVKWLSAEEKDLVAQRLGENTERLSENDRDEGITWEVVKRTLVDGRLWAHYIIFFLASPPFSSLSLFTPSITAGLGFKNLEAQLMTVPPYVAAYVAMILSSYIADKKNARGLVTSAAALVGGAGYLASALLPPTSYSARYGSLIVAACGTFSCVPPLLGWLAGNTQSSAAAGIAIALNISLAAPGQITGIWIYKQTEAKIGYPTGHWTNAGCLLLLAPLSLVLTLYYRRLNAQLKASGSNVRMYLY